MQNHYAILGLEANCTQDEVRDAYRILAKRHHPDLNPGSADAVAMSQAVNAAYAVLSDRARRRAYDEESGISQEAAKPRQSKPQRNLAQDARLRIDEFFRGTTLDVRVDDPGNPSGAERYALAVPADTAPGARVRIPRTNGGFVTVRLKVSPNARFKVRGSDVQSELRIQHQRAKNGGAEMVAAPAGGLVRVQIPAGVARGEVLLVRGQGMPKTHGGRGDLLVKVTYRPEVRIVRG